MGVIETSDQLMAAEPGPVEIVGTAGDLKGRAFVVMADGERFCFVDGLDRWPEGVSGRRVRATGLLELADVVPDPTTRAGGLVTQGISGPSPILRGPRWVV